MPSKWRNGKKWTDEDEREGLVIDPRIFMEMDGLTQEERAERYLARQQNTINQAL